MVYRWFNFIFLVEPCGQIVIQEGLTAGNMEEQKWEVG